MAKPVDNKGGADLPGYASVGRAAAEITPAEVRNKRIPIHWLMTATLLLMLVFVFIAARLITGHIHDSEAQSEINLGLAEHNLTDVQIIGRQMTPLVSHLDALKSAGIEHTYEFELLVLDPERGTDHLVLTADQMLQAINATKTVEGDVLPGELINELQELGYVINDITQEAVITKSPNQLQYLYQDSQDIHAELRSKLEEASSQLEGRLGTMVHDVTDDTTTLHENVDKQQAMLRGLDYVSKWSLGLLTLIVSVASILMYRLLHQRLGEVASYAEQLATGKYGACIRFTSADRIGVMASAVNHMGKTLSHLVEESTSREKRLSNAQRIARLGDWEWDLEGGYWYWSDAANHVIGAGRESPPGNKEAFLLLVHPEDRPALAEKLDNVIIDRQQFSIELRLISPDRTKAIVRVQGEVFDHGAGQARRITGTIQDITERKEAEKRIRHLAYYDVLTGLPNRQLFMERAAWAIELARRNEGYTALLFIDLDRFKSVNDTYGHSVGDELLREVAIRLRQCLRATDEASLNAQDVTSVELSRLGGDEFTVLLTGLEMGEDAAIAAQRIISSLSKPFGHDANEYVVTPSIGIAVYPDDGTDVETLLRNADLSMYHAKETGRNAFRFYTPAMGERSRQRVTIEQELRRALEREELELYYQPKVEIDSANITGAEALIRWQHPERGIVSPLEFIPVAEESGLIIPIGEWVVNSACLQQQAWEKEGYKLVPIAVNISSQQFLTGDLGQTIKQALENANITPQDLQLEITESTLMDDTGKAMKLLLELKEVGIELSLDDFGTGYSSLSYLKRFPIDTLKIDRSFIRDIETDLDNAEIVKAVLAMARSLNLTVVAEGVENESQLEILRVHGCNQAQGFLFSKPVPPDVFARSLSTRNNIRECG